MGLLSLSTSGLLLNKHTLHAMEGRRAGGVHRRGPGRGEVPFLSLALAALVCSRGCLLTRQGHFLLCILYFNKRFLKRGTATPPLWWVREGFPGNRTPTPKWKRWRVCQVKDNRKGHSPREWCSRGQQCPHVTKRKKAQHHWHLAGKEEL